MQFDTIGLFDWIKRLPDNLIDLTSSGVNSPETLAELGINADDIPLKGDNLYGYTPLKEAIANQYEITPDRVAITPGASMGNFVVSSLLSGHGDQIIVETPVNQPFVSVAKAVTGLDPLRLERKRCDDYHLKVDSLKQMNTTACKLMILSNLHNPSGVYDSSDTFTHLADVVAEQNGWVLVDEVFLPFIEGGERQSAALFHDRIISTCSLTKVWGLSTLRIGWVIASPEIVQRIEHAMDYMHVVQPFITEYIAWRVLSDETLNKRLLSSARSIASANTELVNAYLKDIPEFEYIQPDGGISVLIRFRDGRNSELFTDRLYHEFNTVVIPGRYFEVEDGFRISFGGEEDVVRQGLEAIRKAIF